MSRASRLALLAAAGLTITAPAFAQATVKQEPIKPITELAGSATFNAYCTACHGSEGKGNGPAAKALTTAPSDLTQIAKRHDGKFPGNAVRSQIVGDNATLAHGTRDMPLWGPVFRSTEGGAASEIRLKNLVDYLEKIQQR